MRAVIQRVESASVKADSQLISKIGKGILVFIGVGKEDTDKDADYVASKIMGLRIFEDNEGKMNLSLADINGQALIVSQFTLFGDCRKGKRPSFESAADMERAKALYLFLDDDNLAWWEWVYAVSESEKEIFRGYPDGTFGPEIILNRAEAAKIICKSFLTDCPNG